MSLYIILLDGRSYETCHISIPKTDIIDRVHFSQYDSKSLNLISEKRCVGNKIFFFSNSDGKIEIFICRKKSLSKNKLFCYFHLMH